MLGGLIAALQVLPVDQVCLPPCAPVFARAFGIGTALTRLRLTK